MMSILWWSRTNHMNWIWNVFIHHISPSVAEFIKPCDPVMIKADGSRSTAGWVSLVINVPSLHISKEFAFKSFFSGFTWKDIPKFPKPSLISIVWRPWRSLSSPCWSCWSHRNIYVSVQISSLQRNILGPFHVVRSLFRLENWSVFACLHDPCSNTSCNRPVE